MDIPSISSDQVAAFVELAHQGNIRRAAEELRITEQGLRNRLITLEERLGVELYRKARGGRTGTPLTERGRQFLPRAKAFLEHARELAELFESPSDQEIHVVSSQYLVMYLLIDAVRRFRTKFPQIHVRLGTRSEREIEELLLSDPSVSLGVAAPYEPSHELEYTHLFSMHWSLVTPRRHPLSTVRRFSIESIAAEPLILYERGSTGRQHVVEAFQKSNLSPKVILETTNTEIIVKMVEAGLGVAIVPLLGTGEVTKGKKVTARSLGKAIRPIRSGILTRSGDQLTPAAREFMGFIQAEHTSE